MVNPMKVQKLILLAIILLVLNACGKKGPVRPIDTNLTDTKQTETSSQSKNCSN